MDNLNKNLYLEKWGNEFIIPQLEEIVSKIKINHNDILSYSRIETTKNDTIFSWLISTVLKPYMFENTDIHEVVLSISFQIKGRNIFLDGDISLEDGRILYEIDRYFILDLNSKEECIHINNLLLQFFDMSFYFIQKGINLISEENKKGNVSDFN
ncbi:hypothetical protein [Gilliamella sp. Lep-s5]|uniref:hypothetical protein n=2 Tax=Gilliamella TaxID=1193503 RepID=UPI00130A9B1C|nr:hypothetical protein [Gilliamella sp. Lep-s5]MWP69698.1 hypothetical protein [Gilliamella sp. Lep-s5]MWP78009.1 hypothetical protein [Gilliamella sp. Lep-s21]